MSINVLSHSWRMNSNNKVKDIDSTFKEDDIGNM